MWRRLGLLPPLPLPLPSSPSARSWLRCRGDKAGGAPRSPPLPGPLALAPGSFPSRQPRSRARPLLSPIVPRKQNGGIGGEDPVRAHPSPPRGPSSRGSASRRGCARTGPPAAASPGPGFVCGGAPRARTCWEHTPPSGLEHPGPRGRGHPSSSPPLPLCPTPAPGFRRVPGSGGGKRGLLCLYTARRGGPPPWNSVPTRITEEAFLGSLGSQVCSARPPPYQDLNLREGLRFPFFLVQVLH